VLSQLPTVLLLAASFRSHCSSHGAAAHVTGDQGVQNIFVATEQAHWNVVLLLQLHIVKRRLPVESAEPLAAPALGKRATDAQKQAARQRLLRSMPSRLFPFPQPSADDTGVAKRRKKAAADTGQLLHTTLRKSATVASERLRAWEAAAVDPEAFELLHPGGRPLEIKLCAPWRCLGIRLSNRYDAPCSGCHMRSQRRKARLWQTALNLIALCRGKACDCVMLKCDAHATCGGTCAAAAWSAADALPVDAPPAAARADAADGAQGADALPAPASPAAQDLADAAPNDCSAPACVASHSVPEAALEAAGAAAATSAGRVGSGELPGTAAPAPLPVEAGNDAEIADLLPRVAAPPLAPVPPSRALQPERCTTPPPRTGHAAPSAAAMAAMQCPTPPRAPCLSCGSAWPKVIVQ
jgi:hypothetical protein